MSPKPGRAAGFRKRRPAKARRDASSGSSPGLPSEGAAATDEPQVGPSLRQLRAERSLSLAKLAEASGVSRAMLGQIELGQSVPTIGILWKIARALGVPFSALLGGGSQPRPQVLAAKEAKLMASRDGRFTSRALFPSDQRGGAEFYELRLAVDGTEEADAHPIGTRENLVVHQGHLELTLQSEQLLLGPHDAVTFHADVPHRYRNTGKDTLIMYLVILYAPRHLR